MAFIARQSTITVIIPAYNEEGNVIGTVNEVIAALGQRFRDYEILIVNDGSKDRTGEEADELAASNSRTKVLRNAVNVGFGASYRRGVAAAKNDYVAFFPADNAVASEHMGKLFDRIGEADIISHFTTNLEVRVPVRRVLSRLYTAIMNQLFGMHQNYFNGLTIHRREVIQAAKMSTGGFAFLSEVMVRLIRSGHSCLEVGIPIRERKQGSSSALRPRNVISVFKTVGTLFWDVNVKNRSIYNHWPQSRSITTAEHADDLNHAVEGVAGSLPPK